MQGVIQQFRRWLRQSLAHRLTSYSVATATGLAVALGMVVLPVLTVQAVRNYDAQIANQIVRITDRVELRLESVYQAFRQLAKNSFVVNAYVDSTGREIYLQPTLRDFVLPFGLEGRVALFDAGGSLFATSKALSENEVSLLQPLAREALANKTVRITLERDLAAPLIFVAIPIYYPPASDYEGVLMGIVPVGGVLESVKGEVTSGQCLRFESEGHGVAHFGCDESNDATATIGHDLLPSYPGVVVAKLAQNRSLLYRNLATFFIAYLFLAGTAVLLTFYVSRVASRRFADQLKSLSDASRQLVTNPQAQVRVAWTDPDEIGEFADAFGRMVAALQQLHADLERRVSERTAELKDALERAEAANTAKSQFLATMSHEIRTPLNGVLGMAQLLTMSDLTEVERSEYVQTIINSGQTLLTILNDILDFSKVESGRMGLALAPFEPASLLIQSDALFGQAARSKGLIFTSEWIGPANTIYVGDSGRIRQMISNLIGNAIKFTNHGEVSICARELQRDDQGALLEFRVNDTGIGIPPDKQDRLFKPFSQVDSSETRSYGGTGLGLSIVRSFAQLMRGEVGVTSTRGKGSSFWFSVSCPISAIDESAVIHETLAQISNHAHALHEKQQPNILVVEDVETNQRVICGILSRLGYHPILASNGLEAIEKLASTRGEILAVLMDIQMPVLDGVEATIRIRVEEIAKDLPKIPIIALTAGVLGDERDRCMRAGMTDFLVKPVDIEKLKVLLESISVTDRSSTK